MINGKLPRIIAILIIAILGLPIAHAQASGGFNWIFVIINAIIVGIILFLLQSFILPNKGDKEKTAVWVIIGLASLVIAFIYGNNTFIWNGPLGIFFNYYVIVNAAIIAGILYFLAGLAKIQQTNETKTGYTLLILLVSTIFAVKLGSQWIWDQRSIANFIAYLFGKEGILNPDPPLYRLWVFISSSVLFSFFFTTWLLPDAKNKVTNIVMAILIASSMARAGVSMGSVVILGELFFVLILWTALRQSFGTAGGQNPLLAFLISLVMVGWASAALTATAPEYRGFLGGIACNTFSSLGCSAGATPASNGTLGGIIGVGLLGIGLIPLILGLVGGIVVYRFAGGGWKGLIAAIAAALILFLIITGLSFTSIVFAFVIFLVIAIMIGKGLGGGKSGWGKDARRRIMQSIIKKFQDSKGLSVFAHDYLGWRNQVHPNELTYEIKYMRFQIYCLMNWMLRHEIWKLKAGSVERKAKEMSQEVEPVLQTTLQNEESVRNSLKGHIEGAEIVNKGDYWDVGDSKIDLSETEGEDRVISTVGWGRNYFLIVQFMNELKKDLQQNLSGGVSAQGQLEETSFLNTLKHLIDTHDNAISETRYGKFLTGIRRFKAVNKTRAYRLWFYDMYNMYGEYVRGFHFAKPTTDDERIIATLYQPKIDNSNPVQYSIVGKTKTIEEVENSNDKNNLVEVDREGYSVQDINDIQIGMKDKKIRRFKRKDIIFLPRFKEPSRFSTLLTLSSTEWKFAYKDMETGIYHPLSRKFADYDYHMKKTYNMFTKDLPQFMPLESGQTAFDYEGLKVAHHLAYWGKPNWSDDDPTSPLRYPVNPYPTLSLKGLWDFIYGYSINASGDAELTKKLLHSYFKQDYNVLDTLSTQEARNNGRN